MENQQSNTPNSEQKHDNIQTNITADAEVNLTKPEEQEGSSISTHVNQEIVKQLIDMGFSKNVSEKACFLNANSLEKGIEWIYEHQEEPDFEEELRIVGEKPSVQLTPEEIKQKAKELQEYARKRYVQRQKDLEDEQEKSRVRQSKIIYYSSQGTVDSQKRDGRC